MENQHSHSLRDTSRSKASGLSIARLDRHSVLTVFVVCMLIAALVMVILNPDSAIQRGALGISIVALATLLNSKPRSKEFQIRRAADHQSTLEKLRNE